MTVLLLVESLLLVAAGWIQWRKARVETPRRGRAFGFFVLAMALFLAASVGADALFRRTGLVGTTTAAAALLYAVQVVRALLLAWALRCWLEVTRPRLARSWRGVWILISLGFIALLPGSTIAFGILMTIPLARLKWTRHVHGWGRAGLLVAFAALTLALSTRFDVTMSRTDAATVSATFGAGGALTEVTGTLPQPAASIVALARPWEHAIRTMVVLVRITVLIAFLQLLVVPIRLRGLSLKRRFTVTLAMYRFIPGTLGFAFLVLTIYLGIGLHRASLVTNTFDATLEQALAAAEANAGAATAPRVPPPGTSGERAYAVVRTLEWAVAAGDSSGKESWVAHERAASPGTPPALAAANFFAAMPADTATGLAERGGALYLRAAVVRRAGARATGSEVFVAVDSTYLSRIGAKIHSDVHMDVAPNVFVGETEVRIEGSRNTGWADSAYTVAAPFSARVANPELIDRRLFLARTFLPVGNWRAGLDENGIGAVQLKLYTTLRILYESLTGNSFMLTSQLFAIAILAAIAFLFFIVEMSAVRTGRSIIKGIVSDVGTLTDAAARFGHGDLTHRVALTGTDEMGRLATTFNRMVESIEENQEVLLEKQRLEADLAVAREIQQRMLPQAPPSIPGLDVAGLSIPSREVGGDLFYFLPVSGGRLGITIGDVSGKSVPAALLMSNVLAALRSEARIVDREDEILGHLNRLIVEQVEPGRFVTFFYGVVDPSAGVLRYACAGHNPPLLMRASGNAQWLEEAGVPLGVVAESTYRPFEVALARGDVIVLYSDGVTEAQRAVEPADTQEEHGETIHEFFDEHRLETIVRDARDKSAASIVTDVMEAVREFTGGAEQSDDLTLVVVKITGANA